MLRAIDRLAGHGSNRSRVIEQALAAWLADQERVARDARDLEILDRRADALNREMTEALEFQEQP